MTRIEDGVWLWGDKSIHPGVPNKDIRGAIHAEPAGLIFKPSPSQSKGWLIRALSTATESKYSSIVMPWPNIKNITNRQETKGQLESLMGFPISYLTLGAVSWGDVTCLNVYFHDDEYHMDATLVFIIGEAVRLERKAIRLTKQIWGERAKYYRDAGDAASPKRRGG